MGTLVLTRAADTFGPHVYFTTRFCDGSGDVMLCKVINPDKPDPPWSTQELGHGDTKEAALQDAISRCPSGQETTETTP